MLGTDYELFMRIGDVHIPVPDNLDIGSKNGTHVQLGLGTMHRDNIMVELCPDPVDNVPSMINNVMGLVEQAETYLSKKMGETINLSFEPSLSFEPHLLQSLNAQELGCDRDWLAANGQGICRTPLNATILGKDRCAGGHVHLSYGEPDKVPEAIAIHFSDLVLGTLEATMGTQGVRRKFYGLGGLFRPKTYGNIKGVEYRTPSNLWLANKNRIEAMATNALSMEAVFKNETVSKIAGFIKTHWTVLHIQNTIALENVDQARMFLQAAQDEFPQYPWKLGE